MHYTNVANWSTCRPLNLRPNKAATPALNNNSSTAPYDREITRAGYLYGLDPRLIRAVIQTESNFNPQALSPKGAQGLMQLMPATARELKVDNSFDPWQNIAGGSRYLKELLSRFDNQLSLALAAYNAGAGRVEETGAIPEITETQNYVRNVLKYYRQLQQEAVAVPLSLNQ
ncbi:MAG: lytic transglycosylase domain-containing protein [Desulfobulbaceae bacterium]|uniref:Lytic transglycosylase domain-containing protein n=1 Tax=Candidatus Desulfatifera sulfidica TaxID=2841691 RepID=A0A8J6N5E5_9BACT|nr:lytic transglycosylase domain-containing protein [Candidatus Desulfatifera sulfidica]